MKELDELIVQKLVADQKTQKAVDNDANDCNNDPGSDSDEDKYSSDYFEKDEHEDMKDMLLSDCSLNRKPKIFRYSETKSMPK